MMSWSATTGAARSGGKKPRTCTKLSHTLLYKSRRIIAVCWAILHPADANACSPPSPALQTFGLVGVRGQASRGGFIANDQLDSAQDWRADHHCALPLRRHARLRGSLCVVSEGATAVRSAHPLQHRQW